ncbi:hypothetical protein ER308_01225 [Egibacter rhizosphaerae]|uniref:Uncharacterized protein n=1 Tax=Egibacter rhizosphaerae TaxID=1670831 RepID=A0A411YAW0_9ACTN|nr:hypothetical protein [Egibacter rhizosphaerae]QBI18326.1 hypothetical protein ER308_01225 [Egibacter rhizosphaerae]
MTDVTSYERATAEQVRAHADQLRAAAQAAGLSNVRIRDDGTLVVHSPDPGYRQIFDLADRAEDIVGCYVHVIGDNVPAAEGARPL